VIPGSDLWHIRSQWLCLLYYWLMTVAYVAQIAGCALMFSGAASTIAGGQKVYIGGLGVQCLFILEFMVLTHMASMKMQSCDRFDRNMVRINLLIWVIYIVQVLLLVSWSGPIPLSVADLTCEPWQLDPNYLSNSRLRPRREHIECTGHE
jgi:hypothetical protein